MVNHYLNQYKLQVNSHSLNSLESTLSEDAYYITNFSIVILEKILKHVSLFICMLNFEPLLGPPY